MTLIPQATIRSLMEESHAAARQARKMGDPRAGDFSRIAREVDALFSMSVPDVIPAVRGANVEAAR